MAIWSRNEPLDGLVHHSDRGVQYLSVVCTERLAAEGGVTSVGSKGDSYDNALAESVIGLYKSEFIHNPRRGPWRAVEDVELATLGWVHWWNTARLHSAIGDLPPAEIERLWLQTNRRTTLSGPESDAEDGGGRKTPEEPSPKQLVLGPGVT